MSVNQLATQCLLLLAVYQLMTVSGLPTAQNEGRGPVIETYAAVESPQVAADTPETNEEMKRVSSSVETQAAVDIKPGVSLEMGHESNEVETQVTDMSDSTLKKERDSQEVGKQEAADQSDLSSEMEHESLEVGTQDVANISSSSSTEEKKQEYQEVEEHADGEVFDSTQKTEAPLVHSLAEDFLYDQGGLEPTKELTNESKVEQYGNGCPWPEATNVVVTPVFWGFVNVSCQPGYEYTAGPQWIITQCLDNNRWSHTPRSCSRVNCPSLRSYTNANLNTTYISYETKVNVSCAVGQQLMRASSNWLITECRADRTWSVEPSKCLSASPGTPIVSNTIYAGGPVYAIVYYNNEIYVVRQGLRFVAVYDSTSLRLSREIPIPALGTYPVGLAISPANNYLYVADRDNFRVHRVDLSTNIVTGWSVLYNSPRGVSVTRDGNVLVAIYSQSRFIEYTPTGSFVREIVDSNLIWQTVERSDGTLVVTRSSPAHGILLMARDGRVIRAFGGSPGVATTQMNSPRQTAVDSEGNIFVADTNNNRIQLLDASLTLARPLPLSQGVALAYPHALCYDESRGRLFVGEESGQFRVLAFDGVTNIY